MSSSHRLRRHIPDALAMLAIAFAMPAMALTMLTLAMLALGGPKPALRGRFQPKDKSGEPRPPGFTPGNPLLCLIVEPN